MFFSQRDPTDGWPGGRDDARDFRGGGGAGGGGGGGAGTGVAGP